MDEDQLDIAGKTVRSVEQGNMTLEITFTDGSVLRVTAGGQGEIWLNTDLKE